MARRSAKEALDNARRHLAGDKAEEPNASNRAGLIRSAVAEIATLDAQKAEINEQIAAIKGRIKGELGMKLIDFSIALRLYKLEHDDRDSALDTIRECFEALGIGEQGTLFPSAALPSNVEPLAAMGAGQ